MPLTSFAEHHRFIKRALRIRQMRVAGYGIAVASVLAATGLRWAVAGQVVEGLPFITYYPAIILSALLGGLGAAILATSLSAALAWYLFLPPAFSLTLEPAAAGSLLLFVFISAINIGLVWLLDISVDRLLDQERNMRVLIESAPNGIVLVDDDGQIKLVNESTEKLFGYNRSELIGKSVEVLVPTTVAEAHQKYREAYAQQATTRPMGAGRDLSGRRKDGSEFALEIGLNPLSRNGTTAVLATVIDISERKQAELQRQFLARELEHRSQNLISVIQAIARTSFRTGDSLQEIQARFMDRLAALGRAHRRLARAAWQGAPFAEILREELETFSDRITIRGCEITLNAAAAQQFALVVHELATNATKHGALSRPGGTVTIEGNVESSDGEQMLRFKWREQGGPPVAVPVRKGFGSFILIESMKGHDWKATIDFAADGLSYELLLPLEAIMSVRAADAARSA